MRKTWLPLALVLLLPSASCAGETACTELACEHEAVVSFPGGLVSGAYDLVLEGQSEMVAARCLDPGSPEAAENPDGLTCNAGGFELVGHALANERELLVTITPDGEDTVSEAVRLEAVDERTPNGPDCPPICFIRNGQVRLGLGG